MPTFSQLEDYLLAVNSYHELKICTVDSWGNEIFTSLDKELTRQRQWVVCGRCQFSARRMLAALLEQRAVASSPSGQGEAAASMRAALMHLNVALGLAWEEEQRAEVQSARAEAQHALSQLEGMAEDDV